MLRAITNWIQNNLTYRTEDKKNQTDIEFNTRLLNKYKRYNNSIVYSEKLLFAATEFVKMNHEIRGNDVKAIQNKEGGESVKISEQDTVTFKNKEPSTYKFSTTEKGDIIKKKSLEKEANKPLKVSVGSTTSASRAVPKVKSQKEFTAKELISFTERQEKSERLEAWIRDKEENDKASEILEVPLPFRTVEKRSSLTDLKNLLAMCPQPQSTSTYKNLKSLQLTSDQVQLMSQQVGKMKSGMERLQNIAKKFQCNDKFREDINFLIANVGPAIAKSEAIRNSKMSCPPKHDEETEK